MADMVTKQELEAAKIDVENLGQAVNEEAVVTPRYGDPYKSAPLTIKELQAQADEVVAQGFYKGFATEAALKASLLDVAEMRARADDTRKIWRWNRTSAEGVTPVTGTWTDTGLSDLDQSKNYADEVSKLNATEKVKEVAVITNSQAFLHGYKDGEGNIYAYYDNNGNLVLAGLDQSVQEEITKVKTKANMISIEPKATDLHHFTDEDKNLVAKIDENGKLYLTGLSQSVQDYLNGQQSLDYSNPKTFKTKADLYSVDVSSALQSNTVKAPIGCGLLQQQYHVGKKWINNLSMPVSSNRIVIGAYNDLGTATAWVADSGVVHPNVIKFDEPVCGFKYWMGINPYTDTNENYELPYIYGSNSDALDSWTLIPDFAQPFDVDPPNTGGVMSAHLSDSAFTYDPINGELWFFWRQTLYFDAGRTRENAKQTYFAKKTKDGTNWSERLVLYTQYTMNNDVRLSPAIVFNANDGLFYLYYITFAGALGCETSESLTNPNWKKVADIQLPFVGWHLEMKWLGDSLVALVHSDTVDQLYLGISRDMKTFEWGTGLFNAATNLYKSSFIPVFNDNNEILLKIVYTTDQSSNPKWQLHTTQTNFTTIKD